MIVTPLEPILFKDFILFLSFELPTASLTTVAVKFLRIEP